MGLLDGAAWEKEFERRGVTLTGRLEGRMTDKEHFSRVQEAVDYLNKALDHAYAAGLDIELDIDSASVLLNEARPDGVTTVLGSQVELSTFARKFV